MGGFVCGTALFGEGKTDGGITREASYIFLGRLQGRQAELTGGILVLCVPQELRTKKWLLFKNAFTSVDGRSSLKTFLLKKGKAGQFSIGTVVNKQSGQ